MTVKKATLYVFSLYLAMFLLGEALSLVKPLIEPITGQGLQMINKVIFAVGLLIVVYKLKLQRQCGLVLKVNWRTLPIYWPFALIAGLTLSTGINTDTSISVLAIIFVTTLAVGIGEELMFRGLVFHWFRDLSVRKQILISAFSFGGLHLLGLLSSIDSTIIFAQIYFVAGLGITIAYARARDYSIMLPIMVHVIFDFITIGSKGGVVEAATTAAPEQMVVAILAVGTIAWVWGGFLLWKAGNKSMFVSPPLNISTV
jgi:membrane protease YdiL (CAAX protease family)